MKRGAEGYSDDAEKTGRGIDRIHEGSISYGRQWPDYTDSTGNRVVLFIPRGKADIPFAKMIADYQNIKGRPPGIFINYQIGERWKVEEDCRGKIRKIQISQKGEQM